MASALPWLFLDSQWSTRSKDCSSTMYLEISSKYWDSDKYRYLHFTYCYLFLLFCRLDTSSEYSVWSIFYSDNGNEMETCVYIHTQAKMHEKHIKKEIFWVLFLPPAYPKAFGGDGMRMRRMQWIYTYRLFWCIVDFNLLKRQILC